MKADDDRIANGRLPTVTTAEKSRLLVYIYKNKGDVIYSTTTSWLDWIPEPWRSLSKRTPSSRLTFPLRKSCVQLLLVSLTKTLLRPVVYMVVLVILAGAEKSFESFLPYRYLHFPFFAPSFLNWNCLVEPGWKVRYSILVVTGRNWSMSFVSRRLLQVLDWRVYTVKIGLLPRHQSRGEVIIRERERET